MVVPRILVCSLALIAVVSCDSTSPNPGHDAEAVIVFFHDSSHLVASDTVSRGVDFDLSFESFGDCTMSAAQDDVVHSNQDLYIRSYDHFPDVDACNQRMIYIARHTVRLRVDVAGPATIHVTGIQEGAVNGPVELTRQVIVR